VKQRAGTHQSTVFLSLDAPLVSELRAELIVDARQQRSRLVPILHGRRRPVAHHVGVRKDVEQRVDVTCIEPTQPHARGIERGQGFSVDHARSNSS
jgi:hypothetical protein